MAQRYTLNNPPTIGFDNLELRKVLEWALAQFQQIESTQAQEEIQLTVTHVNPAKPTVGELRYADGTNWNPGGGAGVYEYTNGGVNGWRMLASGTQY